MSMIYAKSPPSKSADSMYILDWRKALRAPPTYRIGNTTLRFHFHIAFMLVALFILMVMFFYIQPASKSSYPTPDNWSPKDIVYKGHGNAYNSTYPLSAAITSANMRTWKIGIIADLDTNSKVPDAKNTWRSYYKKGYISWTPSQEALVVSVDAEQPLELRNSYALKGRGMELSELVTFNGRLLTFDDRTGFVYELLNDRVVVPWVLLMDGDGRSQKGFKSEWASVKDNVLYVGSMGKEWTTSMGDFESFDPMYVKAITTSGEVHHINWVDNYKAIRSAMGIEWPGYMIHESAMWSTVHQKWFFLPRRCSKEKYNETRDEHMGCNVLISADENFNHIKVVTLGKYKPTYGFSSFKFVPGTDDHIIVALQTEELNGHTSTFITAFTVDGKELLASQKLITDLKYEGLEFV